MAYFFASESAAVGEAGKGFAVTEMDKVVQQNAAHTEKSASAAKELSAQAAEVNRMCSAEITARGEVRRTIPRANPSTNLVRFFRLI